MTIIMQFHARLTYQEYIDMINYKNLYAFSLTRNWLGSYIYYWNWRNNNIIPKMCSLWRRKNVTLKWVNWSRYLHTQSKLVSSLEVLEVVFNLISLIIFSFHEKKTNPYPPWEFKSIKKLWFNYSPQNWANKIAWRGWVPST